MPEAALVETLRASKATPTTLPASTKRPERTSE